jgi:hypothetical protein
MNATVIMSLSFVVKDIPKGTEESELESKIFKKLFKRGFNEAFINDFEIDFGATLEEDDEVDNVISFKSLK